MDYPVTIAVLMITGTVTFLAFQNRALWERLMFKPREILAYKQYDRVFTSGFIHLDWFHFGFNAFSLYSFGRNVEMACGAGAWLAIYFASIAGGSLLSLFVHRHHDYRALGASGGVCGMIFAHIFLLPGGGVMIFPLPIAIPDYLYAVLFLVISFISHRKQIGNIGHDAHMGGAIVGLLTATALYPSQVFSNLSLFIAVLVISILILGVLVFNPLLTFRGGINRWTREPAGDERSRRYAENRRRNQKMAEIDQLLDKVAKQGVDSLTEAERRRLEDLSK